jgi:adenylosuccinate synthase
MLPSGLINPDCISIIGNGVVIHLPSFFAEIKKTEEKGISVAGRLFVSSRAHLVLDVHQVIDGLKEGELSVKGQDLGTTRKGIGPAYSSKVSRSGLRVHDLFNFDIFEEKLRKIVANKMRRFGDFEYNIDAEIESYKVIVI